MASNQGSSSVVLDNVDDYLAPSQACINPAFQPQAAESISKRENPSSDPPSSGGSVVVVPLRRRRVVRRAMVSNEQEKEITVTKKEDAVKASIADCLACSGCVTTAETVLLEQRHSLSSLRKRLSVPPGQLRALTMSPNSWADICRYWKLKPSRSVFSKFTTLMHRVVHAHLVVDGNLPLHWTWFDEAREFVEVYRNSETSATGATDKSTTVPFPSTAVDTEHCRIYQPDGTIVESKQPMPPPQLPLLSGSCPALVCLVEKSHHSFVPQLSRALSPMSRMGSILKMASKKKSIAPQPQWDHWAVMPCHDKKLEASRPDFLSANKHVLLVDLVITTQELIELVEEWRSTPSKDTDRTAGSTSPFADYLESMPPAEHLNGLMMDPQIISLECRSVSQNSPCFVTTTMMAAPNEKRNGGPFGARDPSGSLDSSSIVMASGGHADFIFQYAAMDLFGCNVERVEWHPTSFVTKSSSSNASKMPIKSARLARQQMQHSYLAQLYQHPDGSYQQTPPTSSPDEPCRPVLSFGIAQGMQTLQRALKYTKEEEDDMCKNNNKGSSSPLHYLEAMACPFGCVNGGGGAINAPPGGGGRETPTETRHRVHSTLAHLTILDPCSAISSNNNSRPDLVLRTRYHVVPPMQHSLGVAAGVQVEKLQW